MDNQEKFVCYAMWGMVILFIIGATYITYL